MAAFTVIDHTELTGDAPTYNVTSIASSYDHLYLLASMKHDRTSSGLEVVRLQFNGSATAADYNCTWILASDGTITSSREGGTDPGPRVAYVPSSHADYTDTFANMALWVPHFASSNFKQVTARCCTPSSNGAAQIALLAAGLWESTDAIDEVELTTYSGNFVQYSTFTLYGVTGA